MDNNVQPIPGGPELKEALQGATFGFGEEGLAGARSLIPGQPGYQESLKAEREQLRKYEAESPGGAMAYQAAGALVVPALGEIEAIRAAAPAATRALETGGNLALSALKKYNPQFYARLPEAVKAMTTGAEVGAKTGLGGGEDTESRLTGAATGAVLGPAVALGSKIIVDTAAPVFRSLFGHPDEKAASKIAAALEADRTTPEELAKRLQKAGKKGEVTLADVGGENLRSLMRVATHLPGETRETATKFLDERQLDQFQRINRDVEDLMIQGKGKDVGSLKRDLDTVRKQASDPLYKQANDAKIENTQELADLMHRMPTGVLDAGRRIYKTDGLPIPKLPANVEELVSTNLLDKDGNIISYRVKTEPNDFRTYDLVKKGLDDAIGKEQDPVTGRFTDYGRSLVNLKKDYVDYLDKVNPAYGQARSVWAGPTQAQHLLDEGKRFFNENPADLNFKLSNLNSGEKAYFRLGAAQAIKEAMSGRGDMMNKAVQMFGSPRARELIKPLFPSERAFNEFANRMDTELQMAKTRGYLSPTSGSKTAGLMTDIKEMGEGAPSALGYLMQGRPGLAAAQMLPGVYGKTTGMTPEINAAIQKQLLSPGVSTADLARQVAKARENELRFGRRKGLTEQALTVPVTMPTPTEQYRK